MHRVHLTYTLSGENSSPQHDLHHPLMALLSAVHDTGSISGAARALDLSYRHVWGELKRWEGELGQTLVTWVKGQPALLSPFGEKLLWAERQAQARLAPQIEALRAELEHAFAAAFDPAVQVLTLHASHDEALVALRDHANRHAGLHLDVRFTGSVDAIRALNEGRCSLAGFHVREQAERTSATARAYRARLKPGQHKLIGFARRTQGLMVAPGNPRHIAGLADLLRPGLRFVNRERGTGTRVLLEELLARDGIPPEQIRGWHDTEPSHTAVAQTIAAGLADAGLGIEAAARARGLDFVPLMEEDYRLVCLKSALDTPAVLALRALLQSEAWQQALAALPGYRPVDCGRVLSMSRVLPWWNFSRRKPAHR